MVQAIETVELPVRGMTVPTLICGPVDGPVALLLHGFPDHPQSFESLMHRLAVTGFRAVAPTARGYVPSTLAPDGDYQLETLAGDAVGCLDALGVGKAHLVGHDWGAVVAHGGRTPSGRFASRPPWPYPISRDCIAPSSACRACFSAPGIRPFSVPGCRTGRYSAGLGARALAVGAGLPRSGGRLGHRAGGRAGAPL